MTPRKPKEVAEIVRRLRENAKASGSPRGRVYCFYDEQTKAWCICDNYEFHSPGALVYRGKRWFYQPCCGSGEPEKPYTYEQALGDSECWFTG